MLKKSKETFAKFKRTVASDAFEDVKFIENHCPIWRYFVFL